MSEISLQAVQFGPRFVSVIVLLTLTWLIARFAKHLVLRATCECRTEEGAREKLSKGIANTAFWSVFFLMLPFGMSVSGLGTSWLYSLQMAEAQVFVNWPVWMILSLAVAGIAFVLRGVPKVYVQFKSSVGASQSEI